MQQPEEILFPLVLSHPRFNLHIISQTTNPTQMAVTQLPNQSANLLIILRAVYSFTPTLFSCHRHNHHFVQQSYILRSNVSIAVLLFSFFNHKNKSGFNCDLQRLWLHFLQRNVAAQQTVSHQSQMEPDVNVFLSRRPVCFCVVLNTGAPLMKLYLL